MPRGVQNKTPKDYINIKDKIKNKKTTKKSQKKLQKKSSKNYQKLFTGLRLSLLIWHKDK